MWEIIRCWYWWKRCQPTWNIVQYGEVEITDEKGMETTSFNINIPISISYRNNDDTYDLEIDRFPILLLYHKGKGKDGEPFKLNSHSKGIHRVEPLSNHLIKYNFNVRIRAKPKLGDTTNYRIKEEGRASLSTHSHYLTGKLKLVDKNESNASVIWKTRNNEEGK